MKKCQHFNMCGGCDYYDISYEEELAKKENYVKELFSKPYPDLAINPIIASPSENFYRNKIQMTFKRSKTGQVVAGFYQENTHKIIPIEKCLTQNEEGTRVVHSVEKALSQNKIEAYNEDTSSGLVRHVLVRTGINTKEIMVVIITISEMFPGRKNFLNSLLKLEPNIKTVVQNINSRDTSVVLGNKERVLYGNGFIYDKLGDFVFKISPKSFYQVNPLQTVQLYKKVLELARLNKRDTFLDLYAGIGTIGMFAAKSVKKVKSVEVNKQAHFDAIQNAKINKIDNMEFVLMDSTEYMLGSEEKVDIICLDPPRSGSSRECIDGILRMKPKRIVYVSCEPTTLIRDLAYFKVEYNISVVQPMDMFPRTKHVETIALLTAKK